MDLKEEDILGADIGRHWYYRSKAPRSAAWWPPRAAAPARYRRGLGLLLPSSADRGRRAIRALRRHRLRERPRRERSTASRCFIAATSGPTDCDLVLMMDVLEHVDDDRAPGAPLRGQGAVRRAFPGDGAGLPLPVERPRRLPRAQAALRAGRDRDDDARRRPAGRHAAPIISASSSRWPPPCASPRAATTEPRSSLTRHGALTNGMLTAVCAAELPLLPINRLAGLSAFVLARKP